MRIALALLVIGMTACGTPPAPPPPAPPTMPSVDRHHVDWAGTYGGELPCADCPGILTRLRLDTAGNYRLHLVYHGRPDSVQGHMGRFTWDAAGRILTLDEQGEGQRYELDRGRLWHLDRDGQRITGALADRYILLKDRPTPRP